MNQSKSNRPGIPKAYPAGATFKPTAKWRKTAHNCPAHHEPLYALAHGSTGKILQVKCPKCAGGIPRTVNVTTEPQGDF